VSDDDITAMCRQYADPESGQDLVPAEAGAAA
jgi:hypothetical protein